MNIVILTGAGISAESGIKTFRDNGGLWENHRVEEVASAEGFKANPDLVYRFYNDRRRQLLAPELKPNDGHEAIAHLINTLSSKENITIQLITQNVDNLHERAGAKDVWHMHGELMKMRCQETGEVFESLESFDATTPCPCCQQQGNLRPHIVWFGEHPFYLDKAFSLLALCDLFISIGTSGHVYPAAQFVSMTPDDCHRIEVNLEGTPVSHNFNEHITGAAGVVLPKLVQRILKDIP